MAEADFERIISLTEETNRTVARLEATYAHLETNLEKFGSRFETDIDRMRGVIDNVNVNLARKSDHEKRIESLEEDRRKVTWIVLASVIIALLGLVIGQNRP